MQSINILQALISGSQKSGHCLCWTSRNNMHFYISIRLTCAGKGFRVQGFQNKPKPRKALKLVVDQTNAIGLKGNQMFKNPCVLEIFPIIFEATVSN